MERNKAADAFVDCVVHRGDRDMMLKPSLFIAGLFVPVVVGTIAAFAVLWLDSSNGHAAFPEERYDECVTAMLLTAFIAEAALSSFMLFCVTRRNRNHLKRDAEWMEALSGFVDFHGGDSAPMRRIALGNRSVIGGTVAKLSMAIWILLTLALVALGIGIYGAYDSTSFDDVTVVAMIMSVPVMLVLMLQFAITVGSVFLFPSSHDALQAKFTEEFADRCAGFGFRADRMEHTVLRRDIWPHLILIVVTLGLYSFVYLFISCKEMNKHLSEQWAYEEKLMRDIVRFEGGAGIECVGKAPKGSSRAPTGIWPCSGPARYLKIKHRYPWLVPT